MFLAFRVYNNIMADAKQTAWYSINISLLEIIEINIFEHIMVNLGFINGKFYQIFIIIRGNTRLLVFKNKKNSHNCILWIGFISIIIIK